MSPIDMLGVLSVTQEGAGQASSGKVDADQYNAVADFVGDCLDLSDSQTLGDFESLVRREAPQALPWYLSIVRTLAGTLPQEDMMHHLVLIPIASKGSVDQSLELGTSRHEIEGSLESALNLGDGTLRLLPRAVGFRRLCDMRPVDWYRLTAGEADSDIPLGCEKFGSAGGAMVGRWSVERSDKVRISRKLVHATQRTPELVSWQQRVTAMLEERVGGAPLAVYPALQLQEFFSGFRQIQLVRELEIAFRALPKARTLQWNWIDSQVICSISDAQGRSLRVRSHFPDESRTVVRDRLRGFCTRRGLRPEPRLL